MPIGDETLMENLACEGEVGYEESCNAGDGEEIMIEVVGSDVFVDGVSGHDDGLGKEGLEGGMECFGDESVVGGNVGSRAVGDLGGQFWDGRTNAGVQGFQDFPEAFDGRAGEVLEKEGIVVVPEPSSEQRHVGEGGMVGEGKVLGEAELVDGRNKAPGNLAQGSDVLDDEVWNSGIDAVVEAKSDQGVVVQKEDSKVDREEDLGCKDALPDNDVVTVCLQSLEKDQISAVEIISEVSADVQGPVGLATAGESLYPFTGGTETNVDDQNLRSSGDGKATKDYRAADNNASHGEMGAETLSVSELPNNTADGGVASVVGNASETDSLHTVGVDTLTGKNVSAGSVTGVVSEMESSIRKTNAVVQGEIPSVGNVEDSGTELDATFCDGKNETVTHSRDSVKGDTVCGSRGDTLAAPESTVEQSSVLEKGDWTVMHIDEVLDFKDEAILVDSPEAILCSVENTEEHSGKRTTEEHANMAREYTQVIANNKDANFSREFSDGSESVQKNEEFNTLDIIGGAENKVVMEENSFSTGEQNPNVIPMGISIESQVAVEVPARDHHSERRALIAEVGYKVEKEAANGSEDGGLYCDPKEDAELRIANASGRAIDSNSEVTTSIKDDTTEVVARLSETLPQEVHVDRSKDTLLVDVIQNEGAYAASISNVQISAVSESAGVSACFVGEADIGNLLPEGNGNSDVDYVSHETLQPNGDQTNRTSGADEVDQLIRSKNDCCHSNGSDMMQVDIPEIKSSEDQKDIGVGKLYEDGEQFDHREQDLSSEENASETDVSNRMEEKTAKLPSFLSMHQDGYFPPPENEGAFAVTDLVWGKVRSHPWWPGQIFDPADASEKAVKYYKKDCFLVAYFGDHTFAWNDASLLKPFRPHFSNIEKQSRSEAFQSAVSCALDEVTRRVELGLSCSCRPRDAYGKIEYQVVENTGIRKESSRRQGVDKSAGAISFQPDKLLQYMRSLAESPFCLVDRLELVLAQAQLSAFCRFKGYREPPAFERWDVTFDSDATTLASNDAIDEPVSISNDDEQLSSYMRRQNSKDNLHSRKERSLAELMTDMEYSPEGEDFFDGEAPSVSVSTSGKKRKAVDSVNDGSDRRVTFYAAKVSTTSSSPKPSFKVGDCIRRVASQLTGSAPILKGNSDQAGTDTSPPVTEDFEQGIAVVPTEISSLEEMLSQLQLAACDPKKGYSFLRNIIVFFSGFRNSVVRKDTSIGRSGGGRKRKAIHKTGGSTEEFEFDDVNDSYWAGRIVQNYSEEQLLQNNENYDRDYQLVVSEPNRFHRSGRGSHSRKRYSTGNYEMSADEQSEDVDRKRLEVSPAELILTFAESDRLPSEINLNKMFRRFGLLEESETEVDHDSHRARVIFKKGADAEVACSSAGRINIFGSMVVSYQISYSSSTASSSFPLLMLHGSEYTT